MIIMSTTKIGGGARGRAQDQLLSTQTSRSATVSPAVASLRWFSATHRVTFRACVRVISMPTSSRSDIAALTVLPRFYIAIFVFEYTVEIVPNFPGVTRDRPQSSPERREGPRGSCVTIYSFYLCCTGDKIEGLHNFSGVT